MFAFWKKLNRQEKIAILASFFTYFVTGAYALLSGSLMPDLSESYQFNSAFSGVLLSGFSIGKLAAMLGISFLALRFGEKRSAIGLLIPSVVALVMIAVCGARPVLLICFILLGVGCGAMTNYAGPLVSRISDGDNAANNLLNGCFAIGAILIPLAVLICRSTVGWQAAPVLLALLGAVTVLLFLRIRPTSGGASDEKEMLPGFAFMKDGYFWMLCAMLFFYLCSEFSINGWLVTYIQNKKELAEAFTDESKLEAYSQAMSMLLWGVILVGRLICAGLSSKVNTRVMIAVCTCIMAVFFGVMLLSTSIPVLTFAVAATGLGMSGMFPMLYTQAAPYTNRYSLASGCFLSISTCGGLLMPTVVGILADALGFSAGMIAILVSIVTLMILCLIHCITKAHPANQ